MSARTTAERIREIIDTEVIDLTLFINDAYLIVSEVLEPSVDYSEARLEMIERYFAAHLIASGISQLAASETAGPVSEKKQYHLANNLRSTMYGQQVVALDSSGILASLGSKRKTFSIESLDSVDDTLRGY